MIKKRTNVNGVYTPVKRYNCNYAIVSIASNGVNEDVTKEDDGKRLKINVYGDWVKMTGLYKHGFTIEASSTEEVKKLKALFFHIAHTICKWDERLNEPPHWANGNNEYSTENTKIWVIEDINDAETIEELEYIGDTIKGWLLCEDVMIAFHKKKLELESNSEDIPLDKLLRLQTYKQDETTNKEKA